MSAARVGFTLPAPFEDAVRNMAAKHLVSETEAA